MTDIIQMSKGGTNFYPQTKVQAVLGLQDSLVGTNLLLDSKTQMESQSWSTNNSDWSKNWGTYLGSNVYRATNAWDNIRYSYKDLLDRGVINTTDDFAYSVYFRVVGEDPAGMSYAKIYFQSKATTKNANIPLQLTSLKKGQWVRIVVPFKFIDFEYDQTKDDDQNYIRDYSIRLEVSAVPKVAGAYYEYAAPKLEKGSTATDYSLNPLDIATDGSVQKAITNALGKVATINVISQADYDKLADKSGVYFIKGGD